MRIGNRQEAVGNSESSHQVSTNNLSINLADFKPPRLPIARTAAPMGHSDNLNGGLGDPVNFRGKLGGEISLYPANAWSTAQDRSGFGVIEFRDESVDCVRHTNRRPLLPQRSRQDEPNAWERPTDRPRICRRATDHGIVFILPWSRSCDASRNLLSPRRFDILIDCFIQAFQQTTRKRGACLGGKTQRLFQDFLMIGFHACRLIARMGFR